MFTELLQNDLNGKRLAAEIIALLDAKRNQGLRALLAEVRHNLGGGDASRRTAERVLTAIRKWQS